VQCSAVQHPCSSSWKSLRCRREKKSSVKATRRERERDTLCVCVCVCVWSWNMFLTILDDFLKCFSFFFRLSEWPFSTCYGEVVTYCCGLKFFEMPFLSPIMISMQANQSERTSWLLYFLSCVDPAKALLTYPTCKNNGNLCLY
jgi:hypothetical protein